MAGWAKGLAAKSVCRTTGTVSVIRVMDLSGAVLRARLAACPAATAIEV
jgi:hypothetical protein